MTIELDPTPALVVVDLQSGILGQQTAHPLDQIIANSAQLAAAFRAQSLPVVLVNVDGTAPGRTERNKASGRSGAQTLPGPATALLPSSITSRATSPSPSEAWAPSSRPTWTRSSSRPAPRRSC